MSSAVHRVLCLGVTVLLAGVLLTHPYIDLGAAAPLPLPGGRTWAFDAPLSDLLAMALGPVAVLAVLLGSGAPGRPPLPGPAGWGLLVLANALSLTHALDPPGALHHLLRKPVFVYVVYGLGLSWAAARVVPRRHTMALIVGAAGLTAAISLLTSAVRILGGDGLWYQPIAGLTPNHKTLAVCLAGWLPLLWVAARQRRGMARAVLGLVVLALVASASKTAWLGGLLALACYLPRSRPLAWRPGRILPLGVLALSFALLSPLLLDSRTMLDAARARHSLNVRSWQMFTAHPVVGSGSGMSTDVELVTFPHYRINGVDAHGAVQKVGGEAGLLGLCGLGLFVLGTGRSLRRRLEDVEAEEIRPAEGRRGPLAALSPRGLSPAGEVAYAGLATFVVLHGELLLSTELYSPTHWVPLATAFGLAHARRGAPPARATAEVPCAS